jgi:hypothetical protein
MYSAQLLILSLPAADATVTAVSIEAAVKPTIVDLKIVPVFMIPPRNFTSFEDQTYYCVTSLYPGLTVQSIRRLSVK